MLTHTIIKKPGAKEKPLAQIVVVTPAAEFRTQCQASQDQLGMWAGGSLIPGVPRICLWQCCLLVLMGPGLLVAVCLPGLECKAARTGVLAGSGFGYCSSASSGN